MKMNVRKLMGFYGNAHIIIDEAKSSFPLEIESSQNRLKSPPRMIDEKRIFLVSRKRSHHIITVSINSLLLPLLIPHANSPTRTRGNDSSIEVGLKSA